MPFGEEGGMTPHRSVLSMMVRGTSMPSVAENQN